MKLSVGIELKRYVFRVIKVVLMLTFIVLALNQSLLASSVPATGHPSRVVTNVDYKAATAPTSTIDYDHSHFAENGYDSIHHSSAVVPSSYSTASTVGSGSSTASGHHVIPTVREWVYLGRLGKQSMYIKENSK